MPQDEEKARGPSGRQAGPPPARFRAPVPVGTPAGDGTREPTAAPPTPPQAGLDGTAAPDARADAPAREAPNSNQNDVADAAAAPEADPAQAGGSRANTAFLVLRE